MKSKLLGILAIFISYSLMAQVDKVAVQQDNTGVRLVVNGEDFMINGMNWDYIPIGLNTVNAGFWNNPDDIIKAGLDTEMTLLKNMNVNVIRQYTDVPARWIQYIYENYGIYTMLNHSFGRYGLTIDGVWIEITDYANPRTQEFLLSEVQQLVEGYKDTPGLLMYLLGNENNYGLFWAGAETEDFPDDEEEKKFIGEKRGRPMYRLMNDAAKLMKGMDANHPVAICNGDVLFIDIVAEECQDVDIYGTNTYRGVSFGDMFDVVKEKLNKPLMFTEFGADAFNAITNAEDQKSQAYYNVGNWKEIYENAAGLGKANNSIGGFTFQFSDGWWKYGFNDRKGADVHDNNASWANGGYPIDLAPGANNMNEEWFGICAKGQTDIRGLYELYPRAAYYALQEAHALNPYAAGTTLESVQNYFENISVMDAVLRARSDKAALAGSQSGKVRVSGIRAEFTTLHTGGDLITTPKDADPNDESTFPNMQGFDHMESYFLDVEANPSASVKANISFNILGNVATNPINEIFYENRGRARSVETDEGDLRLTDLNRVQVYRGDFKWNSKLFNLTGFYRTGHFHWGYEGDFFGLYPEANYGPNLDIYNGEAPFGFEIEGKKLLKGLKIAYGPELWWGANPSILLKYSTELGHTKVTGIYHEDVDDQAVAITSVVPIPQPRTRRLALHAQRKYGKFTVDVGGLWAGQPLVGREYNIVRTDASGNYEELTDVVENSDNWGGKVKLTYEGGRFNWYGQAAAQGLVAGGGADLTRTFTGWKLKDTGSGNQYNFLSGFTYNFGNLQIAPNFLWQKPLVDPIPFDAPFRKRDILTDPFVVRSNRETIAGEILFSYDPTPATWMYEWDNDRTEDAKFAFNLGFVFRHLPTSQDAAVGFDDTGRNPIAFPLAPPAEDLWELHGRIVSKMSPDTGLIFNFYTAKAQPNAWASDPTDIINRTITRYGTDLRLIHKSIKFIGAVKVDDWGPFDYHRDFNLTFPLQLSADLSTAVGKPDWFILPGTQIGIRYIWRSLDQFSPRYIYKGSVDQGFDNGSEWEIRTYVHINIGK